MNKKKFMLYSICLTLFIDAIGVGLIFPILPELFMNNESGLIVGGSTWLSREVLYSISFALFPLSGIFGMPILGALSDKYGRSKIILCGLGMLTSNYLLSVISVLIHNVWLFLLTRLLSGFLSGTYAVGSALISDVCDNDQERISNFKLPALASTLGFISGPGLSIFISKLDVTNTLIIPFIITFVLGVVNLLLLCNSFKNIGLKNIDYTTNLDVISLNISIGNNKFNTLLSALKSMFASLGYIFSNKYTKVLAFSYLLLQFGFGLFVQSLSLYLTLNYNYTPSNIARFFVIMSIIMIISMYLLQKLATKFFNYKVQIDLGLIIISILLILESIWGKAVSNILQLEYIYITWLTNAIFYLLIPFITLGFTSLFANIGGKKEQGKVMGGSGQIYSISWAISGLIIGKLIMDYHLILLISGVSFMLSYIILKMK